MDQTSSSIHAGSSDAAMGPASSAAAAPGACVCRCDPFCRPSESISEIGPCPIPPAGPLDRGRGMCLPLQQTPTYRIHGFGTFNPALSLPSQKHLSMLLTFHHCSTDRASPSPSTAAPTTEARLRPAPARIGRLHPPPRLVRLNRSRHKHQLRQRCVCHGWPLEPQQSVQHRLPFFFFGADHRESLT